MKIIFDYIGKAKVIDNSLELCDEVYLDESVLDKLMINNRLDDQILKAMNFYLLRNHENAIPYQWRITEEPTMSPKSDLFPLGQCQIKEEQGILAQHVFSIAGYVAVHISNQGKLIYTCKY